MTQTMSIERKPCWPDDGEWQWSGEEMLTWWAPASSATLALCHRAPRQSASSSRTPSSLTTATGTRSWHRKTDLRHITSHSSSRSVNSFKHNDIWAKHKSWLGILTRGSLEKFRKKSDKIKMSVWTTFFGLVCHLLFVFNLFSTLTKTPFTGSYNFNMLSDVQWFKNISSRAV